MICIGLLLRETLVPSGILTDESVYYYSLNSSNCLIESGAY